MLNSKPWPLAAGLCLLSSLLVHARPSQADDPTANAPNANQNAANQPGETGRRTQKDKIRNRRDVPAVKYRKCFAAANRTHTLTGCRQQPEEDT